MTTGAPRRVRRVAIVGLVGTATGDVSESSVSSVGVSILAGGLTVGSLTINGGMLAAGGCCWTGVALLRVLRFVGAAVTTGTGAGGGGGGGDGGGAIGSDGFACSVDDSKIMRA